MVEAGDGRWVGFVPAYRTAIFTSASQADPMELFDPELKWPPRPPETILSPKTKVEPRCLESAPSPAYGDRLPLREPPNSASTSKFGITRVKPGRIHADCVEAPLVSACCNTPGVVPTRSIDPSEGLCSQELGIAVPDSGIAKVVAEIMALHS